MADHHFVTTQRLKLVPWHSDHLEGLFKMNSDPVVMRYIRAPQTRDEVAQSIKVQQDRWQKFGFGWWSMFEKTSNQIIGAACVQYLAHIETNPLEIGWRLIPSAQGQGYATEAGQAAIDFAFYEVCVDHLKAVADPQNVASIRVMQRLGMRSVGTQIHYDVPCATYEINKVDIQNPAQGV